MIVTTKQLFAAAYGKYAIGAYNINNLEQTMGLFRGNMDSQAPFIIQISKGARSFTHKTLLEGLIRAADEVFPDAIFAVHLDHGDEATCYDCIQSGFYSSVMIDASSEPFEENVATTRRVVDAAHAKGIVVEAELGQLGGVELFLQLLIHPQQLLRTHLLDLVGSRRRRAALLHKALPRGRGQHQRTGHDHAEERTEAMVDQP
jgi:fructose/tagatose bisphosphate aldolase